MAAALAALVVAVLLARSAPSEKGCLTSSDCACGISIRTGECFYGNRKYVNESVQCPDFCTGIGGHLRLACIQGECRMVRVEPSAE